jgi:hypothetical protein
VTHGREKIFSRLQGRRSNVFCLPQFLLGLSARGSFIVEQLLGAVQFCENPL